MTDTTTRRNQLTRRVQVLLSGGAGPYLAVIETGSGCDQTAAEPAPPEKHKCPRHLGIRTVPLLGGGAYRRGIDVCWLRNDAGMHSANHSLLGSGSDRGAAGQDFRLLGVELCLRQHAGVEQLLQTLQLCDSVRHLRGDDLPLDDFALDS